MILRHLLLFASSLCWCSCSPTSTELNPSSPGEIPPQVFLREPMDQTATLHSNVFLPCRVQNKKGILQWTRDGFGLGVERNLTGFDRYTMTGSDEEGKIIASVQKQ